nr:hypothetical protein GCM10020092_103990 [Actinoplanes digitatis]
MKFGAKPTATSKTPNASVAPRTTYTLGRLLRPLPASAPHSAPAARAVVSSPKDDGPAWKLIFASAARVTGKLKPIMPIAAISVRGSSRSCRFQTYFRPSTIRVSPADGRAMERCRSSGRMLR